MLVRPALIAVSFCGLLAACGSASDPHFTGYMEGDLLLVGAERAGRLVSVTADEGRTVAAGALLFAVDAQSSEAAQAQGQARVAEAEARLADAHAARQRPADIAVLAAAGDRAAAALALSRQDLARVQPLAARGFVSRARLDAARAALARDEASLSEANRRLVQARQPGRPADIAAAEAALAAARAALRESEIGLGKLTVAAPVGGAVEEVYFRPGEIVAAGQPVVALLPPDRLKVRFFVPETQLAAATIGRTVSVSCDSCAAGMTARISFVARTAEFTPPVILSRDERERLVFMVEAVPTGAAARLTAGQPVDVRLRP